MNQEVEKALSKFIEEQMVLMEDFMGPLAQKYKSHFDDNEVAYFKWLNFAYQLKSTHPNINEDMLSPMALSQPLGKSEGFKF